MVLHVRVSRKLVGYMICICIGDIRGYVGLSASRMRGAFPGSPYQNKLDFWKYLRRNDIVIRAQKNKARIPLAMPFSPCEILESSEASTAKSRYLREARRATKP